MDLIDIFDTLGLVASSLYVRQTITEEDELIYSCKMQKYNRYGFT